MMRESIWPVSSPNQTQPLHWIIFLFFAWKINMRPTEKGVGLLTFQTALCFWSITSSTPCRDWKWIVKLFLSQLISDGAAEQEFRDYGYIWSWMKKKRSFLADFSPWLLHWTPEGWRPATFRSLFALRGWKVWFVNCLTSGLLLFTKTAAVGNMAWGQLCLQLRHTEPCFVLSQSSPSAKRAKGLYNEQIVLWHQPALMEIPFALELKNSSRHSG